MKKIDLRNYSIKVLLSNGERKEISYNVKDSMVNILFTPELKLSGREVLQVNKLATKIEDCEEDEIILETVDYEKLSRAVDTFRGFGKNDVEFISRVLEAKDVEVKEKDDS